MKLRWPLLLAVLSSILLGLLWLVVSRLSSPAEVEDRRAQDVGVEDSRMPTLPKASEETSQTQEKEKTVPQPSWDEDAIPGQHVVTFSSEESLNAFLEKAGERGIQVRGRLSQSPTVLVLGAFDSFQDLLPADAERTNNHLVRVPAPPDTTHLDLSASSPVRDQVLSLLGLSSFEGIQNWGAGVKIAVLDTGLGQHAVFQDKSIRRLDLLGNFGSREGELEGHGTAVAGLLVSSDQFAPGLAPASELLGIRVLDAEGRGDAFTLAEGIYQAVGNDADIINMSLGTYGSSKVLQRAVEYAAARGVVLVAASGNDGREQVTYPAAYSEVLGVAAVDAESSRVPFSNFGAQVDLSAPGFQIHALWPDSKYVYFDGTSAAAPLVSATAAKLVSDGLSREDAIKVLRQYSNDVGMPGKDSEYGTGVLSAGRVVNRSKSGVYDIALADLYPAVEQEVSGSFPLYVSLQNRGTEFLPSAKVELTVDGQGFFYQFNGFEVSGTQSVQVPISVARLKSGLSSEVKAKVVLPGDYEEDDLGNNEGNITLSQEPAKEGK